jgi:hypothetical protein
MFLHPTAHPQKVDSEDLLYLDETLDIHSETKPAVRFPRPPMPELDQI